MILPSPRITAAAFGLLLALSIAAFWKPYLGRLADVTPRLMHLHAVLMAAWCALLLVQPWLIARRQRSLHHAIGRSAWFVAPAIVVSSLLLAWQVTKPATGAAIEPFRYELFIVQVLSALTFGGCAAMALARRHDAASHARWMVASGLTFLDPVFARVFTHLIVGPPWVGDYGSSLVADGVVLLLVVFDRRGRGIFGTLLAALLAMQAMWLTLPRWAPWRQAMDALFG